MPDSKDSQSDLHARKNRGLFPGLDSKQLSMLLKVVIALPRTWVVASGLLIVASIITLTWGEAKGWSLTLQATAVTAILAALIWLPAIVRLFALTGGEWKTPAGDLTSPGILPLLGYFSEDARAVMIEETALAESATSQADQDASRQFMQILLGLYLENVPVNSSVAVLDELARSYDQLLRSSQQGELPNNQRLLLKVSIIGRMRALVGRLASLGSNPARYFDSDSTGMRLIGILWLQVHPDAQHFQWLIELLNQGVFRGSIFDIELYEILRALEAILLLLNQKQLQLLHQTLAKMPDDEYNQFDAASNRVFQRILDQLGQPDTVRG